jgi:hypothetical protein
VSFHPTMTRSEPYSVHRPSRSPLDAIKLLCRECQGAYREIGADGQVVDHRESQGVRDCPSEHTCSLWKYRFGKDPSRKSNNPAGNPAWRKPKPTDDSLRGAQTGAKLVDRVEAGEAK